MGAKNEGDLKGNPTTKSQLTSGEQEIKVPPEGSLGLLALGYQGLLAWREAKNKSKTK